MTGLSHRQLVDVRTGRVFARAGFDWLAGAAVGEWVRAAVAEHLDCDPDDVAEVETEDGDLITVRGEPAARVERCS